MKPVALCAAHVAVICVTTTASLLYADVQTLTWNGALGAAWTPGENWLDGETSSTWADGASASFGAGASVSLPSSVAVSNLTTAGALAISGPDSNPAFLSSSTPTLVFPGLTLDDIDGSLLMADLNGSAISQYKPAKAYHYKRNGSTATAQFQMTHNGHLRCVKVTFTEDSAGVWARTGAKSYYVHKNNSGELKLGEDIDTDPNTVEWYMTTTVTGSGMTISNMRGAGPRVKVAGSVQLDGAVALTNVTFKTSEPSSRTWSATFHSSNSCFSVKGLSDATEKTFGVLDEAHTAWLTTTASQNVFTNMLLSRVVPVSARMAGNSMGFIANAAPYHVTYDWVNKTMTCQFQFSGNNGTYIKGCKVELAQSGTNVTARATRSYYHVGGTLGEDLDNTSGVTKYDSVSGNGIKSMVLNTVNVPSLKHSGGGAIECLAVDNAEVELTSAGARPTKCMVARNGAHVLFNGSGGNDAGSGKIYTFESGSMLVPIANITAEGEAKYIFDASTLYTPLLHSSWKDGQNMFRYLTLRNGARTIGNPLRCGDVPSPTYFSDGTGPNVLGTGVCLYKISTTPTLYIVTSTDLDVPGNIYSAPGSNGGNFPVTKRGGAKLTLSGENSFGGRFTIEAGTVELASNTALPTSSPMTLKGGCTVTCGATTNSTGALTLSGNATINIGDGALSFADSHDATWAADTTLNIVGNSKLSSKPIRFGTNGSGLTAAQLKQIRYNGDKVSLTGQGYLAGPQGLMITIL